MRSTSTDPSALNRRRFLAIALAGPAAALGRRTRSLADDAATVPLSSWRLRLATSSIHFKDLPIEETCERIAALGFEAIDIWCAYDGCRHLDDIAARLGPDGLRQLLTRHRLKLCAFSCYLGGYRKYAELLGKAGGGVAVQGSAPPCKPEELAGKMRAFLESLQPLAELAERHQSYLAIENHGNALLDSLDSLKAFVDLNRSPRLGVALAPYHLQAASASIEEAIAICGSQLFFFYAWQNRPGIEQLPGHGPTDMTPWLRALARIQYRGYINPFMHGQVRADAMAEALSKSQNYLNGRMKL